MKPNFALKLSNDGIELLHRTVGGWSPVGAFLFQSGDVGEGCAKLVAEAERIEPGFRTKLVMPGDEVRYASVVAPGPTDEARRYQIEAEIERLTPYRIDELAYDWSVEDDLALVAICARETLIEAETFAEGYGFRPVCFVAQPSGGEFAGEPFFGETMVAPTLLPAGAHVQPDSEAIRVVTPRKAPPARAEVIRAEVSKPEIAKADVAKADVAKAEPVAAAKAAPAKPDATKPEPPKPDAAKPATAAPVQRPAAAGPAPATGEAAATTAPTSAPAPAPSRVGNLVRRLGTRLRREQAQAARDAVEGGTPPSPAAVPSAATRQPGPQQPNPAPQRPALAGAAPVTVPGAASPASPGDQPAAPATPASAAPKPPVAAGGAEPVAFASRRQPPPVLATNGAAPAASPSPGGRIAVLPEGGAKAGPPSSGTLLARARNGALAALSGTAAATPAAPRAKVEIAVDPAATGAAPTGKRQPAAPTEALVPASRPPATDEAKSREAEALTIFGARGHQRPAPSLARSGLMAAGGALLLLIAVAVWAIYFNGSDPLPATADRGTVAPATETGQPGIEAPSQLAGTGQQAVAPPAALTPPAPAGAEDTATETGADSDLPLAAAPEGSAAIPDPDQMLEALVQEALNETLPPAAPLPDTSTTAAPDTGTAEAPTAADPVAPVGEQTAQASDAPLPDTGGAASPQLSLPRSIDLPPAGEVTFVPPAPPPPFGSQFSFDEQGLVEATPEGALTPSGVTVFARRPDAVPAPRPAAPEAAAPPDAAPDAAPSPAAEAAPGAPAQPVAAAIESAIAEAVAETAPPAETAAAPETPASESAPVVADDTPRADPALAGARPQPRPARLLPQGEPAPQDSAPATVIPSTPPIELEPDRSQLDQAPGSDTAALTTPPEGATLVAAASTAEATTETTAGESGVTLAALSAPAPGGLSLDGLRPQRRPTDLAPADDPQAPALDLSGATPEAVAQSPVPGTRPGDLAERARAILAAAEQQRQQQQQQAAAAAAASTAAASTAAAAARPVEIEDEAGEVAAAASSAPAIPSSASVARAATQENAIRLNRVNLIGVFGTARDRRALVRLSNGRVVRVQVGDRLEGGQVAAIGENELRYVRNGQNEVLRVGG